ncbi:unnamed protein product [Blepharisma stoltei]|uniref:Uncharacterized protein n=1 Tax=Blepharisma stoltei TaxID=1481888 RepID=A0AAU9JZ59_9CILI|nr:unnamed protein product [Blepharisma stoltei]
MEIYIKKAHRINNFIKKRRLTHKPLKNQHSESEIPEAKSKYLPFIIKSADDCKESTSSIYPFVTPTLKNYSAVRNRPKNIKEYYYKINKSRTFTKTRPIVLKSKINVIRDELISHISNKINLKGVKSDLEERHHLSFEKTSSKSINDIFPKSPTLPAIKHDKKRNQSVSSKAEIIEPIKKIIIKRKSLDAMKVSEFSSGKYRDYFEYTNKFINDELEPWNSSEQTYML